MYGADADELDRLANEFSNAADEIDRSSGSLSRTLNNVMWLGDNALRYLSDWSGVQLPRIGMSTRFLRDAATRLRQNATQQREASAAGGVVSSAAATTGPQTPAQQLEARLDANRKLVEDYVKTLPADNPVRIALERELKTHDVYAFDPANGHIAWATKNLATAPNVVVTVSGTGEGLQQVTEHMGLVERPYLDADGDTAVISTFMWKPPSGIADNVYQNDREQTLVDGPIADVITSLHDSGRSVVVTGHSAGGAAVQTLFEQRPDLVGKVTGVALLAPSEYHPEFVALMGEADKKVLIAVHDDDPIQYAHVDEMGAMIHVGLQPNVILDPRTSGTSALGGFAGLLENSLQGEPAQAHHQWAYTGNYAESITDLFFGDPPLPEGMVRQRIVEADGTVGTVDTGTF